MVSFLRLSACVALLLSAPAAPAAAQQTRGYEDGIAALADQISDRMVSLHDSLTEPMTFYVVPARSAERLVCEPLSGQLTDSFNRQLAREIRDLGREKIAFQMVQGAADDAAITLEWRRVSDRVLRLESRMAIFATMGQAWVAEVHLDTARIPDELRLCVETEYVYAECVADERIRLRNSPRRGSSVGALDPGEEFDVLGAYDIRGERAGALLLAYRRRTDTGTAEEERRAFARGGTEQLLDWRDRGVCDLVDLGRFETRARRREAPWSPYQTVQDDCGGAPCPRMRVLPQGRFALSGGAGGLGGTGIEVEIGRMIAVSEAEITVAEWRACARAGACDPLARTAAPERADDAPVSASHEQALQYVGWLNAVSRRDTYRLPSEAEWEHAARGGSGGRYAWGDVMLRDVAVCRSCADGPAAQGPSDVRRHPPNDWGLYAMSGNLWEWTADCWDGQGGACPSGLRVVKGGSWADGPLSLSIANRAPARESVPHPRIGFRVVATGPGPR
jgi:hypothetical protein